VYVSLCVVTKPIFSLYTSQYAIRTTELLDVKTFVYVEARERMSELEREREKERERGEKKEREREKERESICRDTYVCVCVYILRKRVLLGECFSHNVG
jgi:hypothetical protein